MVSVVIFSFYFAVVVFCFHVPPGFPLSVFLFVCLSFTFNSFYFLKAVQVVSVYLLACFVPFLTLFILFLIELPHATLSLTQCVCLFMCVGSIKHESYLHDSTAKPNKGVSITKTVHVVTAELICTESKLC